MLSFFMGVKELAHRGVSASIFTLYRVVMLVCIMCACRGTRKDNEKSNRCIRNLWGSVAAGLISMFGYGVFVNGRLSLFVGWHNYR